MQRSSRGLEGTAPRTHPHGEVRGDSVRQSGEIWRRVDDLRGHLTPEVVHSSPDLPRPGQTICHSAAPPLCIRVETPTGGRGGCSGVTVSPMASRARPPRRLSGRGSPPACMPSAGYTARKGRLSCSKTVPPEVREEMNEMQGSCQKPARHTTSKTPRKHGRKTSLWLLSPICCASRLCIKTVHHTKSSANVQVRSLVPLFPVVGRGGHTAGDGPHPNPPRGHRAVCDLIRMQTSEGCRRVSRRLLSSLAVVDSWR